jgi:hypothetical protein
MSEIEKRAKLSFLEEFEKARPDLCYSDVWTDDEKAQVLEELRPNKVKAAMFASIPMRCRGSKCPIKNACPLYQKGIAPVGKKCPIEMAMVIQFTKDYQDELGVDENNMTEMAIIRQMVNQEVQQFRVSNRLADEDFMVENPVGIDKDGNVIVKKELHQAIEYEDRIHKRLREYRKELMATREMRAKVGQGVVDSAQAISNIMHELAEIDIEREKALKKRLGTYDRDDYIEGEIVSENGD